MTTTIKFTKLTPTAQIPKQQTRLSSGMDVCSVEQTTIEPHTHKLISTGLKVEIPAGYEIQVRPRSGLAAKHAVTVLNSPGTIDADYRGECKVILINHSSIPFKIEIGDRIAQFVVCPVEHAINCVEVKELTDTDRGEGGFGSTGTK